MFEQSVVIKDIPPRALLGVGDENLTFLETHLGVSISVRGPQMTIKGKKERVNKSIALINKLKRELKKGGGQLTTRDIEYFIYAKNGKENIIVLPDEVIKPRTLNQSRYLKSIENHRIVCAIGPAGTGKTYLAVASAISSLLSGEVSRIVLARPAVEAGESLGFLPGDYEEKVKPYLRPLYDALFEMLPKDKMRKYTEEGIIEIAPLAFMRGRNLSNSFIILDEAQNTTHLQMKMFLTRMGKGSKAVINGDITQIDLPSRETSGLVEIQKILKEIDEISFIYLTSVDVVRNPVVEKIVKAYKKYDEEKNK